MPQQTLADAVGVSLTVLKRWERGLELPSADAIARLALALGADPSVLVAAQRVFVDAATPGEGYTTAQPEKSDHVTRRESPHSGALRVLDLFCGSGGFSYGAEMTGGFAVTAGVDLLLDRAATFTRNHPTADGLAGDIRKIPIPQLGDAAMNPDLVIGGPPCQGFSSIRPFRTYTDDDPRNNLFEHFALIVAQLRPKWFVLENVVGLLTHGGGKVLPQLLAAFRAAGYRTEHAVLNAAHYGLPQNRERLVVVGCREGRRFEFPRPTHASEHRSMAGRRARHSAELLPLFAAGAELAPAVTVMDAISDLPPVAAGESARVYRSDVTPNAYQRRMRDGSPGLTMHEATAHSEKMIEIIRHAGTNRWALPEGMTTSGFSSCYSRLEPDLPSVTITVNFVHPSSNKCIHPYQHRALTPREGARLQGFPDRFVFSGSRTQVVKQIGNAVPPLFGQVIAQALLDQW
jgi:DNA (cytosine-5)-methyltransferase 1